MTRSLILSSVALLTLAACGNSENVATEAETATGDATIETATAAQPGAMPAMGDPAADPNTPAGYAMTAALSDMYEIESSRLALEKSNSAEVKQFAQMMVDGHTQTTAELKSALAAAGVSMTPPATLDARRQAMVDELRGIEAAAFDTAYLDQQTRAHEEALNLHQGFAQSGDSAPLKAFAAKTAPIVQGHLDTVKRLDESGADEPAANPPQ